MSTSTCPNCQKTFAARGFMDSVMHGNLCPDCIRQQKAQQEINQQLDRQAQAVERSAAAAEEQSRAAQNAFAAQAEAVLRESQAKEELLRAQTDVALGQMSAVEIERLGMFKRAEEDRVNIQQLFDKVGNAVACIELGGKDTPHYQEIGYEYENPKTRNKISFVYRFHNLSRAMAHLVDLREEVQRIRVWNANQSREETLRKIQDSLTEGKRVQVDVARKAVRTLRKVRKIYFGVAAVLAGVSPFCFLAWTMLHDGVWGSVGMLCVVFALAPLGLAFTDGRATPIGWDDMRELAGEE
jgi:hypothetical protein